MKNVINIVRVLSLVFLITSLSACQPKSEQANFILIMADDLGWGDTGFNGNSIIKTPNLDQMSADGIIFNRFYSASPVCSPTRASCLTGRNPYRLGIPNANSGHMPQSEITIAELLKEQGYATGHFGKWHLGTFTTEVKDANRGKPGDSTHLSVPSDHGFDTFFSTESKVPTFNPMQKPKFFDESIGESLRYGWKAREKEETGNYGTRYWTGINEEYDADLSGDDTELIMNKALDFISNSAKKDQKFFAVIWTHTPHLPVVADQELRSYYPDETVENQLYFGSITSLDIQMGKLNKKLESLGIKGNTCIFFCSDNGPENGTPGSSGNFRARKRALYEGGVRVPAFVSWPDKISSNQKTNFPAVTSDYLPTILDMLSLKTPKNLELDGISLLPAINGDQEHRNSPIGFLYPGRMSWVTQTYKLISVDKGESFELYNLIEDPSELNNIITSEPDLAKTMQTSLDKWIEGVKNSEHFDPVKSRIK